MGSDLITQYKRYVELSDEYLNKHFVGKEWEHANEFMALEKQFQGMDNRKLCLDEIETLRADRDRLMGEVERFAESLKKLMGEAKGLISAHECALSMDGGNSNMECLRLRIKEADEALNHYQEQQGEEMTPPTNTTNEDKGYTLWYNPYNDLFCELSPHGEKFYGESRICVIHWPPARMRRYGWYYIGDL